MHQLTRQLRRWQSREWLYRFAWGFARWAAIVVGVLAVCCFVDWIIDRSVDTPLWLRVLMTFGQIGLAIGVGYLLLVRLRVPHIDVLAGQAEEAIPEFDHRLVTALQLNRPDAQTAGMSPQLIEAVTMEAENLSTRHNLASLADAKRVEHAALVFVPVVLVAAVFLLLRPTLSSVLLQRQCLFDVPIPRSVAIDNLTPALLPAGDAVRLRFAVKGEFTESSTGRVQMKPDDMPTESYELKYDSKLDGDSALFIAEVPPASTPFTFKAWLHDGRTRTPNRVEFAARPVVSDVAAWLVLPQYVDPAGKVRYERFQPQGEVTTLPDSGLRVEAELSKPVQSATLILYGRPDGRTETEIARIAMVLNEQRTRAEARIESLLDAAVAYRIHCVDEHGFENANPPRRGIASANYQAPTVKLLAEVLKDPKLDRGPLEDFAVDGMPLTFGGRVQIGYNARSPLGISKVFIWYRVNPSDRERDPWTPLPMSLVEPDLAKTGPFIPELGVFENSGLFGQVEFYPLPSADLASEAPGLEAGGRFNFETAAITKTLPNGTRAKLDIGDTVEFLVVAYDRNPAPGRAPGESQSRIKAVVTQSQLEDWSSQQVQSRGRLEELFKKQRRVFQTDKEKSATPRR